MDFRNEALLALESAADRAGSLFSTPTLRLGVTGLSRAGKTVFITALVHNLLKGGRLPGFDAMRSGRIKRVTLDPQPDNLVPRFQYESHVEALTGDRQWPSSTRSISELRLKVEFESESFLARQLGSGVLNIDIIDYPGEWLLDLALMDKSYEQWCAETLEQAELPNRKSLADAWQAEAKAIDPQSPADEAAAQSLHDLFADYLRSCRSDDTALSALPPGRFLMPGDMAGAPALTFAPLPLLPDQKPVGGSWHALMKARYDAYKRQVVYPFFREHFARLDRQIVLVDALQALNAGPAAISDLQTALDNILSAFRTGQGSILSWLMRRQIDRIAFAATKADHVHHGDHDRLAALLGVLVEDAISNAQLSDVDVKTLALASVRSTREAQMKQDGETVPVLVGTPVEGESIGDRTFDGATQGAVFPGDLPAKPRKLIEAGENYAGQMRFVRFRPPLVDETAEESHMHLPHIRLDETLQFLLGDRLA
ncbi:MAG: YcjX family protein [Pseudomonadota bacterium]